MPKRATVQLLHGQMNLDLNNNQIAQQLGLGQFLVKPATMNISLISLWSISARKVALPADLKSACNLVCDPLKKA